ncbi:ChaN family lipoprotein [Aggregicoccus sp. 17bor-14]|uniref:hypothetical protein n=1 Tax=Myxococcaceae TaxID=31 RepID=UPI00129C7F8C|nr:MULTISPECIES: hypothetical protein [Myxococcaceae]MBF5044449.1 hypothetical protein [Simulacricoccus sp. 17bor-14]MRI90195.1 ChaN family lipoprotein [Aggregicoccus sp. 17bor-14]
MDTVNFTKLTRDDAVNFQILSRERLELGEEGPGTPTFDRNFFRDLEAENDLLAHLYPSLRGDVAAATREAGALHAASFAVHLADEAPRAVREARCGETLPGLDEMAKPGGILLLGELHGTQEVPRFMARAVCQVAFEQVPVVLALELPVQEQPALDAYLRSEGGPDDQRALLMGAVWHRPRQDGRTSRAVLELIEHVRVLNRQGLPVSLLAFDSLTLQGNAHEQAMAERLLARRAKEKGSALLVLTGNAHASTERGTEWDPGLVPMGALLARSDYRVRALDVLYDAGQAWTCRLGEKGALSCGIHPEDYHLPHTAHEAVYGAAYRRFDREHRSELLAPFRLYGRDRFFIHGGQHPPRGFHGIFFITRPTASPPADVLTLGTTPAPAASASP